MSGRTLVITLGQLRAHQLTWTNFKENVLDQLGADLAVCVPDDSFFDFTNPYYVNARYRWLVPDAPALAGTFDRIQRLLGASEDWRVLCEVGGIWFGKIAPDRPGAGALQIALHWFILNNIEAARLTEAYDRFVITRSDFYYLCPHPPLDCLDPEHIWIPDGEDYGGLCDRHVVVSAGDLAPSCNIIEDLLRYPRQMREAMSRFADWNIERVTAYHFMRHGIMQKVRRFPYIMFLVRGPADPTAWGVGTYVPELGAAIKYPSEFIEARRYQALIRSKDDWRLYFASRRFPGLFPARIHTRHGTVCYVDGETGELRHGQLADCPANVLFAMENSAGRLVYRSGGRTHDALRLADDGRLFFGDGPGDGDPPAALTFERVAVQGTSLVGLKAGDLYLCAEPGGQVLLNRRQLQLWELFRLVADFRDSGARRPPA